MKVKKLIELLQEVTDEDAEVFTHDPEEGYGHHIAVAVCILDSDGDVIIA